MNRFTFGLGYKEYTVDVDFYKFILGNNTHDKFSMFSIIKSTFNKINNSEFAKEANNKHVLLFNDKAIDMKSWRYFEVTPFFDLESDMKMGSKSLFSKYLESLGEFLEQNETFNTISILLNSLNEDFFDSESSISFGNKIVKLHIGDIGRGTLSKEAYPIITGDGYECNSSDLDYEETIILQLSLIEKIISKNNSKNNLIYCYIPYLTKKIETSIYKMKYVNSFIFIDTMSIPNSDTNNILIMSNYVIDLSNDEDINDKIMDFPFHIEKEDLKNRVKNCLINRRLDFNDRLILELFS